MPTVDPAPIFAAIKVVHNNLELSFLPATKKSAAPFTYFFTKNPANISIMAYIIINIK